MSKLFEKEYYYCRDSYENERNFYGYLNTSCYGPFKEWGDAFLHNEENAIDGHYAVYDKYISIPKIYPSWLKKYFIFDNNKKNDLVLID